MVYLRDLMSGHYGMKGERALKYQATIWKSGKFDILEQYTEVPVLCRIQDRLGATEHCITVLRNWVFDSKLPHAFPKTIKCLNLVCVIRTNKYRISKAQYRCVHEASRVNPLINK